jgi:formyl-CoA transferase/succinyl-CoA--D-citramalate CoA-transferase
VLDDAGVPAGKIYTAAEIVNDPHYAARNMIIDVPEPGLGCETVPMPGVVPKLSATPGSVRTGAPLLGEANDEVWGELLGCGRYEALQTLGVV